RGDRERGRRDCRDDRGHDRRPRPERGGSGMTQTYSRLRAGLGALAHKPYIWGVLGIVALLIVNVTRDPGYLQISVNPANGYLAGNLLDILRESAPIVMISVGMCLVVATSGIDRSVGSVMRSEERRAGTGGRW